jgi:hypothetical protein
MVHGKELNHARWILDRQRIEEHRIGQGKDGSIGADAERQ